jgi:hypothetical protein
VSPKLNPSRFPAKAPVPRNASPAIGPYELSVWQRTCAYRLWGPSLGGTSHKPHSFIQGEADSRFPPSPRC